MFEGKSLWQIFNMGGFTMYILMFCSVISIAVIIERLLNYSKKSKIKRVKLLSTIKSEILKNNLEKAIKICENTIYSPFSKVALAGLKMAPYDEKEISSSMEREIMIETIHLERYTTILGTIGNIAVYIGLFGTVLGIIRSFHDISRIGSGGMTVVIAGVAEALICTATGLMVAIPAVITYNYFVRQVDNFVTEMELSASEIIDLLCGQKHK